jgi:hypothetical protein
MDRPVSALVNQVMTAEPYASARRVFWVADNLPVHATWLNHAEIVFSINQRK